MANSHPGSYCGQDAYNDMFVTEKVNGLVHRERSSTSALSSRESGCIELLTRPTEGIDRERERERERERVAPSVLIVKRAA